MPRFVDVEHPDVESIGRVPESALAHWEKAGWTPVEHPPEPVEVPEGEPSLEWTRPALDAYAAQRLSLDTSGERTKADVLAAIQSVIAAQPDSSTETEES